MFRIRIFSHSSLPSVTGDNDRWRAVNRSDIDFLNLAAVKRFERMISRSGYPRFRNDGRTMADALSVGDRHCAIPDNKRDKRKLPVERGTDLNGEQSEQYARYVVRIGSISGKRRVISNWC